MPYSDKEYQVNNVNYLNKDFTSFKASLVEYAKSYFPNSYRDFNETSPGMMLMEMSAYVGDVLSYYIDSQYKEMILPLAEERRNVINIANMLGYKVKPIYPAHVDITVTQTVDANQDDIDNVIPTWNQAQVLDKGFKILSAEDSSVIFETLDIVDFSASGSFDVEPIISDTDSNGVPTEYTLTRKVRAVSGETKTTTVSVGSPEKFKRITLPETNVIEIISVKDSSNNTWYEVDYLAQSRISEEVHYTEDTRTSAYIDDVDSDGINGMDVVNIPVPYTLNYINTSKRFVIEINEDNTTSLVFGNGVLNTPASGSLVSGYFQSNQAGITIPGNEQGFNAEISPLLGNNALSSLGDIPQNTNFIIKYRVGGGIKANVPSGDLTILEGTPTRLVDGNEVTPIITNEQPARGGQSQQTLEEIKRKTQANFMGQRRCVTKEDYEARTFSLPTKFGNIAKVSVNRREYAGDTTLVNSNSGIGGVNYDKLATIMQLLYDRTVDDTLELSATDITVIQENLDIRDDGEITQDDVDVITSLKAYFNQISANASDFPASIELHILSYDNKKNLTYSPSILHNNLKSYLDEFRMVTDEYSTNNGFIINFGVAFEVVAHKHANKYDVKLRCINKIIEYFDIDKMQFRQPIYTNDLIYEIMGLEGVRGVNYLELTQKQLSGPTAGSVAGAVIFDTPLYNFDSTNQTTAHGGTGDGVGNGNYGYYYDFNDFYDGTISSDGVILPSIEPSVFELKNPNQNIKGVVL